MARESFEDADAAALLNACFISVKLDREERPDIDHILMEACLAINGSGGWPLSVFADADKRIFFAGTYYPNRPRGGMPSFTQLLTRIDALWKDERAALFANADRIHAVLARQPDAGTWPADMPKRYFDALAGSFDAEFGGFGGAPKFPMPHALLFLLSCAHVCAAALPMADKTLKAMHRGGLFDQIGYGFCRYATDRRWLVPHFEKMLYDNALLIMTYAQAFSVTSDPEHRRAAEQTILFLRREMTSPEGAFYSAQDADSEGVEGRYYLWTPDEVGAALGADAERYCRVFDISPGGNFEGKNIPHLIGRPLSGDERVFADACAERLYAARVLRARPATDDKILTSWNGLTIAALAQVGRVLGRPEYTEMADRCWRFIVGTMWRNGALSSAFRAGQVKNAAHAEDYAFVFWGVLELYRATLDEAHIDNMRNIAREMNRLWDEDRGGYFYSRNPGDAGLVRSKPFDDGALPSPNAVAAWCFCWLALLTEDISYQERADTLFSLCAREAGRAPSGHGFMVLASLMRDDGRKLVIAADSRTKADEMLRAVSAEPLLAVRLAIGDDTGYPRAHGQTTAYLCKGQMCLPPIHDIRALREALKP